ncbi:hypothetical protein BO70DRAFT_384419 [Aspergillus heteromorphus CBS 117.55]|uniref:Mitochondrial ribosomal protein n=1 Tax=Aspergillus heteromorphus CBS 117.55 TaxID=1448321 RepID=A0A317WWM1_9EURO|nr:uncharacterized protein BO70DRAFT_384419 [Aspergillus heteromorphus CBS 117.55]PWY90796.1 hypothetical protein BO70DRAFT_384419 [Aspergillus heteromorphus CBS 117.55]
MASPSPILRQLGCFRSLLKPQPQSLLQTGLNRRALSTVYSAKPTPKPIPENLPEQFIRQLPLHLRPKDPKARRPIPPPPPSAFNKCKDPVGAVADAQLAVLDPTGERRALFDYRRSQRSVKPGDIVRVTFKNGDPFNGVCLSIRLRGLDTSFLLRNQLTKVGVEMAVKVYSPNVESVEIVQRAASRKRRARLFYMRNPKHDMGTVENIVTNYIRQKRMLSGKKRAPVKAKK